MNRKQVNIKKDGEFYNLKEELIKYCQMGNNNNTFYTL